MAGKKSLPVLYGLGRNGAFARRWAQGPITAAEVGTLSAELAAEGARGYTLQRADELTVQALEALQSANPQGDAGQALAVLALLLHQLRVSEQGSAHFLVLALDDALRVLELALCLRVAAELVSGIRDAGYSGVLISTIGWEDKLPDILEV